MNNLYFYNINSGHLFQLSGKLKVAKFLKEYPDWRDLDSNDDRLILVKNYFLEHGKKAASDSDLNVKASY
jgi:hypothetical protein